jgi:peptidyl-dipeptidase Dcp
MNAYRNQQKMDGEVLTIVSNNSNFIKGADNAPVLISWTDATTLFHEFGHALHGLSSNVTYPTLYRYCRCQGLCGISFSNFGALA